MHQFCPTISLKFLVYYRFSVGRKTTRFFTSCHPKSKRFSTIYIWNLFFIFVSKSYFAIISDTWWDVLYIIVTIRVIRTLYVIENNVITCDAQENTLWKQNFTPINFVLQYAQFYGIVFTTSGTGCWQVFKTSLLNTSACGCENGFER